MKQMLLILITAILPWAAHAQALTCSSVFSAEKTITETYDSFKAKKLAILKNTTGLQHLSALYEYNKLFATEAKDNASPLSEKRFAEITKKMLMSVTSKEQRLTVEELAYMTSSPRKMKMFEGILYYQVMMEAPIRMIQQYIQYTATRGGSPDFLTAPKASEKGLRFIQSVYNGPLKYMLLIPHGIDLPGGLTPTQKIFKKLWRDPKYQPDAAEMAVLKTYKAESIFKERQDFLNEHRTWVKVRRLGDYALNAIVAVALLEAYNWYEQLNDPEATVEADKFLDSSKYQLASDEVRIYNETVPFPHMAIEMDGLVYSYGQTHMTVKTVREYVLSDVIQEGLTQGQTKEDTLLQKGIAWTGLNKTERVMQTARLKLGQEQKNKLKRHLEMQTGKRYRNYTLALDCASMVVKALKEQAQTEIPAIIDPSPSQVMFYFGGLKTMGAKNSSQQPLVQELLQVRVAKTKENKNHLWRNLYINMMETRVYWSFVGYSAAQRAYLEARYGKDIQYWDDETLDYFKLWESEIREQFQQETHQGQLGLFKETLNTKDPAMKESLRVAMDAYFGMEEQNLREIQESPQSRFEDIYRANLRLALLLETKQRMQSQIK
ncbi:hypothetical protein ACLVWU_13750 [Bdellovibrio sp. HCB290]|uniref:hypothetical protein n=1 Tax=Bdellovibrio sp. HCB290 TaxID=3394356 RepID=UPI0039B5CAC3